jgi:hypothetical protein
MQNDQLLSREESRVLDLELMGDRWGFTSDQLMELAGTTFKRSHDHPHLVKSLTI